MMNSTVQGDWPSSSVYTLVNNIHSADYTLCEMRSYLSIKCSTHLNISGTTGAHMSANCEDENDPVSYHKSDLTAVELEGGNWKWLADAWQSAIYMNSGLKDRIAARDRLLTALPLEDHHLPDKLPSLAEVLVALVSPTLISGAMKAPLVHYWSDEAIKASQTLPGWENPFNATIMRQEYASSFAERWQTVFYIVLALAFVLNLLCLIHLGYQLNGRPLTDFTDPANMFAMAINSPPCQKLAGTCGTGPRGFQLDVPWRIGYSDPTKHFYFHEATEKRQRLNRRSRQDLLNSQMELVDFKDGDTKTKMDDPRQSYIMLSNHKSWL